MPQVVRTLHHQHFQAAFVRLIGLFLCLMSASCTKTNPPSVGATATSTSPDRINPYSGHPFPMKLSGLPFHSSSCGTGQPQRLGEEVACRAIERVFADAGFELQHDVLLTLTSGRFLATGYDVKRRVGYVFASPGNLESDTFIDWQMKQLDRDLRSGVDREISKLQSMTFHASRLPTDLDSVKYEIENLQKYYLPDVLTAAFEVDAKKAEQVADPWKRLGALQTVAVQSAESLVPKYAVDDDELLTWQLHAKKVHPSLQPERRRVMDLVDPEIRKAALKNLLAKDVDAKLSVAEAQELDIASQVGWIAVISPFDKRFEFQHVIERAYNFPDRLKSFVAVRSLLQRHLDAETRIRALTDPANRLQARLDWEESNSRGTVQRLESRVRAFLSWTRREEPH